MKTYVLDTCIAITVGTLLFCLASTILVHVSEQPQYPTDLPAGYCLLTNGDEFAYEKSVRSFDGKVYRIVLDGYSSKEDAIRSAWACREYHPKYKSANMPYLPVNPELCKAAVSK